MLHLLLLTAASYAQDAAVEVGSTPGVVSPGTDAAVVLGLPDLAADAGSALLAYGAGSLSHWAGRRYGGLVGRWGRRVVPVVKVVAGAAIRAAVEVVLLGGSWQIGAVRGLVAGAAAVSGRQVWSRSIRGRVRQ